MMLYRVLRAMVNVFVMLVFLPRIKGRENLPETGGFILVCNHTSNLDPVVLSCVCKRQIRYMAKIEMFKYKTFGAILQKLGAFPVDRGAADVKAVRMSMKIVTDGDVLGIFPEGHRMKTGEVSKVENGVALIAIKTGAPVVPVYINAPYRVFRRLDIVVGDVYEVEKGKSTSLSQVSGHITRFFAQQKQKLKKPHND